MAECVMWLYPKQRLLQQYLAPHCGALWVGVVWDIIHLHPNDQQTLNSHFKSAKYSSLPIYQTDFTRPLPLIYLSPPCLPPWHRQWSPNCFPSLLEPLLLSLWYFWLCTLHQALRTMRLPQSIKSSAYTRYQALCTMHLWSSLFF